MNKAEIEITASSNRLPAMLRAAGRMVEGFAKTTGAVMGGVMKPLLNIGKRAAGNLVGSLALRGIDVLIDAGQDVLKFEEALTRFGIQTKKTPADMRTVGNAARKTGEELGISALEVLKGGIAFAGLTSAATFSIEKMIMLAKAASATGAASGDLAAMMYQLTRSMEVPDNQMEDTMGGLINMAKDGAIEAKEFAREFAGILPLYKRFGVIGREGTIQAAAMFQIIRDGANTAAEAATMTERVFASIQSFAPRFEEKGIRIYEKEMDRFGRKKYRPAIDIMKDQFKSGMFKDSAALKKVYGRTEGWRGILLLFEAWQVSMDKTASKIDQTVPRIQQLMEAGRVNGTIAKDSATFTESASGKINKALVKMQNAVATAFTPERVEAFANMLMQAAGTIMDIAKWLGRDPKKDHKAKVETKTVEVLDAVRKNVGTGLIGSRAAIQMQTVDPKKGLQDSALQDVIDKVIPSSSFLSPEERQKIIREVGGRLGDEITKKGIPSLAAGTLVRRDEDAAAVRRFLGGIGVSRAGGGDGSVELKAALIEVLGPIARALGAAPPIEVKVDGNPIAKAGGNATDKRRK